MRRGGDGREGRYVDPSQSVKPLWQRSAPGLWTCSRFELQNVPRQLTHLGRRPGVEPVITRRESPRSKGAQDCISGEGGWSRQVIDAGHSSRLQLNAGCPGLPKPLVIGEGAGEIGGTRRGAVGQDGRIFDRLRGALGQEGEHGMRGIAEQRNGAA